MMLQQCIQPLVRADLQLQAFHQLLATRDSCQELLANRLIPLTGELTIQTGRALLLEEIIGYPDTVEIAYLMKGETGKACHLVATLPLWTMEQGLRSMLSEAKLEISPSYY
jgi:hypothetical protein